MIDMAKSAHNKYERSDRYNSFRIYSPYSSNRSLPSPAKLPRGVGINCVSPVMDDRLAFGVQDVPSEAIAIYP